MLYSSHATATSPEVSRSVAFEKKVASELIAGWPDDIPFDANLILADHPELRQRKSVVLDLAYEEFCRLLKSGETPEAQEFAARFPDIQRSLTYLIDVHHLLHQNPQFLEEQSEPKWPVVGEKFLDLELIASLGRGAFARVFLARESGIGGRLIVAKLSKSGGREAEYLGRLEHPRIVPILSVKHQAESGLSAICMPYLGRTTLLDLIDGINAQGSLPASGEALLAVIRNFETPSATVSSRENPVRTAWHLSALDALIDLGIQLAEGLEYAHQHGICHGDIKPSNVLITPQGHALLMDFNLSFQAGGLNQARGGTLAYMAPEQLRSLAQSELGEVPVSNEQTDIHALGVVLYELLTGRYPFGEIPINQPRQESAKNLLTRQRSGTPPLRRLNPQIDPQLQACIEKCLAYNPAQRWQSVHELRGALERALSFGQRSRRWLRAHRMLVAGLSVASALLIASTTYELATREPLDSRMYQAGIQALVAQDYETAVSNFEQVLELAPEKHEAQFALGRAHLALEQFKDAHKRFEQYRKTNTEDGRGFAGVAYSLAQLAFHGEFSGSDRDINLHAAIAHFEQSLQDPSISATAIHNNIGFCRLFMGKREQAKSAFLQALAIDPTDPTVHHNLLVAERQDFRRSGRGTPPESLDAALRHGGDHPEILLEAACIHAILASLHAEQNPDLVAEHERKCLEFCERGVAQGLSSKQLDEVKTYHDSLAESDHFRKLQRNSLAQNSIAPLRRLIDPLNDGMEGRFHPRRTDIKTIAHR
jgi:serine/threonine protein kinase